MKKSYSMSKRVAGAVNTNKERVVGQPRFNKEHVVGAIAH